MAKRTGFRSIYSFFTDSKIPKWLLALGYGAEGMLSGNENTTILTTKNAKKRQFYLSLDVDLTKIETNHIFKDIFLCFNT
jgi:hypothetical protein